MNSSSRHHFSRSQILRLIRRVGQISRVELADQTGLSRSAITAISNELIEEGFVREVEAVMPHIGRGRPRQALELNPDAGHVVGIKLSLHQLSCVISNFAGDPVHSATHPFNGNMTPVAAVIRIDDCVQQALAAAGLADANILRMCVGIPGYVSHMSGHAYWSPVFDRTGVDFAGLMNAHFNFDCIVENDTNLATLAEYWFGQAKDLKSFGVISIEHGVGMGLMIEGEVYRGQKGVGPEFGHAKLFPGGEPCRCGQNGCVEAYVADYALLRQVFPQITVADYVADPGGHYQRVLQIIGLAEQGDAAAAEAIVRSGRHLGVALGNLIATLNPATIIMTGDATRRGPLFLDTVREETAKLRIPGDEFDTRLLFSDWGDDVWARGATALALRTTYDEIADRLAQQRLGSSA